MNEPEAVFSVDLEMFHHTPAYRQADGQLENQQVGIEGVEFLLEALDRHGAVATFFVVSELAETNPGIIERVAQGGHEIGSHTHSHRQLSALEPAERQDELARSRQQLESTSGEPVSGFRAPAFDIPPDHFQTLDEAGYRYDSSIVRSRRIPGWYGGTDAEGFEGYGVQRVSDTGIDELPVSVMPGLRLPLTGAWLRFFGTRYARLGMRWLARRGAVPVLYVHPWELVDLPKVNGVPPRVYWRTGSWMRRAVDRILDEAYRFETALDIVDGAGAA